MTRCVPVGSRVAVLVLCVALGMALGSMACAVPVEEGLPYGEHFDEAAATHGVPREILVGIASSESGLVMRGASLDANVDALRDSAALPIDPSGLTLPELGALDDAGEGASTHHPRCFGLLGLCSGSTLDEAAALTGLPPEALLRDARLQVNATAALLAKYRRDAEKGGWEEAVRRFGSRGSPAAGELFVREVARHAPLALANLPVVQESRPDSSLARWVGTNNFRAANRVRGQVDRIVIHTVQGSYAGAISWMQNARSQVSSHYVVRSRDGDVTQMVEEHDVAWHVGCWNGRSIGIEHEGYAEDPGTWYTDAMYRQSARLVREVANRWGIPLDREHILGHNDVSRLSGCNDHWDPGPGWDWTKFMSYVTGGSTPAPTPAPAPVAQTGKLRGAIYDVARPLSEASNRLAGAVVRLSSGQSTTVGSSGMFAFDVPPGDYTLTASKSGYATEQLVRHVSANAETWGSMGLRLVAPPAAHGKFVGVIYDAARGSSARLSGVVVRLSGGLAATTDSTGYFEFDVPVGAYTATASKSGWQTGSQARSVTANQTVWGSIGLRP